MVSLAIACNIADFKNYTTNQLEALKKLRPSRDQRFVQLRLHAIPKMDYALEALDLTEDLIERLRRVEEQAYADFGLIPAPSNFPKRWQRRRNEFLDQARKGDKENNWRSYFASKYEKT
eukprot:Lithocolla_globosa_v1_NODE_1393_length_2612_cov_3.151349.p4 type:complete len:119 gc:universal NODE_1393_length_2612_cov_3.151349:1597-1241(-)